MLVFCFLAICAFFTALVVGSALFCLLLSIMGIIALAVAFSYMGLFFLSSLSLLAYAGIFIVLFLISKKCLPDEPDKLKTVLMFVLGLIVTVMLCCLIPNDPLVYRVSTGLDDDEGAINLVVVGLIILVGLLAAIFSKYDFSLNIKRKGDTVRMIEMKDKDDK